MEFYVFLRSALAWIASIACVFPLNVPILYFAHRIREGRLEEDDDNRMDSDELRTRSILGALALFVLTAGFLFTDVVLAKWADMPPGIIHFVVFLCYIPAAAYVLMQFFAYDDYFHGLGLLTLYLGLPIALLLVVNLTGIWDRVHGYFLGFLKEVPITP